MRVAERLVEFHERFAPLFGKGQVEDHAYTYVKGLMVCPERKSIEPIALNVGDGQVSALQKFVNIAPWDYSDVQAEIHSCFGDELVPSSVGSPIGTVGVVDESGFTKKGNHMPGVARSPRPSRPRSPPTSPPTPTSWTMPGGARSSATATSPSGPSTPASGAIEVKQPRVHDRRARRASGRSSRPPILPPYLRRTKSMEELIPWLYLKGISTGDFSEALQAILGPDAKGLSATTVTRLKAVWEEDIEAWSKRSLAGKHYVYVWADGVHFNIRLEEDRQCILVLMGATADGKKELIAITDGYRESEQSWKELLLD